MLPVIRVSEDLYSRLGELTEGFDTPANVIERLLEETGRGASKSVATTKGSKMITNEMFERAYELGVDAHAKTSTIADAQSRLVDEVDMHPGSARDYVNNFLKMMDGECYKRTMKGAATDFYLWKIESDFGVKELRRALSAVDKHIAYYEQSSPGKLRNIRAIHNKYSGHL